MVVANIQNFDKTAKLCVSVAEGGADNRIPRSGVAELWVFSKGPDFDQCMLEQRRVGVNAQPRRQLGWDPAQRAAGRRCWTAANDLGWFVCHPCSNIADCRAATLWNYLVTRSLAIEHLH